MTKDDEIKQLAENEIRYMRNTGLHQVAAAHGIVSKMADATRLSDPETSQVLYRVGAYLCRQVSDLCSAGKYRA